MYYWDYIYSKESNCIISLDTSYKNNNQISKSFLDIKIFSQDGSPVENAYIKLSAPDEFNEFKVEINSLGYYPVQINNLQIHPGLLCKLKLILNPLQLKNKSPNYNQVINLPSYEIMKIDTSDLIQEDVRNMSLTLGIDSPKDTVTYLYGKKFADEVYELSNGKINIEVFTDGKMGADREMFKTIIQNGSPNFIIQTTAHEVDFIPELALYDMPMVYNDISNLRNLINNDEFTKKIDNAYIDSGYKLLGMSDILFRQMSSNKEINSIDDFKGIKIRTIQNRNHEAFWKSLGATVIPLPSSEIYTSLKFNYIDAQENPYDVIAGFKLYDVQDYIINTCHLPHLLALITSDEFYNSLTASEKSIIDEAAKRATEYAKEKSIERIEENKKVLMDNGMKIIDLPEDVLREMRCLAFPIYEKICEDIDDLDLVYTYMENSDNFKH
ncbi:tripartite ATP-independent transporter DctP family solute receptor [Sedimentibacter acidaminivorans]|uniref:Tripartite ATP-independent transporter DctP family solute receptor n=1 Tax=Sedimentibacter acidaminivorans TaxID=913099 RepID=A0ABS4GEU3_9FIRM|nr:TRAP transporter substrate-binding protein [Sedimentibacter acidaminivorans]MBP1926218.1 tripartite ATP-independent transporter DctP family solute receptor [Sedimentibacter acidaminivorans]